jgi:hypothetical protein
MPPVQRDDPDGRSSDRAQDLEVRISSIENNVAIAFSIIALVITLDFLAWFWIRVLKFLLY